MNIFVTGGTGFIGSLVVKRLVQDGYQVTCLVRRTSDTRKLMELGVRLIEGDVTEVIFFPTHTCPSCISRM